MVDSYFSLYCTIKENCELWKEKYFWKITEKLTFGELVFIWKCVNWWSGTCLSKSQNQSLYHIISNKIWLGRIKKRWVPYFLKMSPCLKRSQYVKRIAGTSWVNDCQRKRDKVSATSWSFLLKGWTVHKNHPSKSRLQFEIDSLELVLDHDKISPLHRDRQCFLRGFWLGQSKV